MNPGLSDSYSFAGSITTDGTTGAFGPGPVGQIFSPSPIIDWYVSLNTPGNDGESNEILTPRNSFIELNQERVLAVNEGTLVITESEIYLEANSGGEFSTSFGFESNPIPAGGPDLKFTGPDLIRNGTFLRAGEVFIIDSGDSPSLGSTFVETNARTLIATVVPEPSSATLVMVALGYFVQRRNRI